jgi:PAS domain S-box-containing protein
VLSATLSPVKFLLVDDREENLRAFESILRRSGLELVTARSAPAALEQLLRHDFALAIIDVQMPEMDGVELAELMRGSERTQHVPIILVTAGSHERSRLFRGYEAGAVDYLYKPIEPVVLRNKAETFYELYRQKQQLARQLELLRESEEFRSRLFDATEDEMLVLDLDGRIKWGNAAAQRFFGARLFADPSRAAWLELWLEESRQAALTALDEARYDRVGRFIGETARDFGEACCDVVLTPIHDARCHVDRVLAIARDITEQRRASAERERLTRELEETLRLNEMFVAAVGHDLRNPLSAVIAGAQLIGKRSRDLDALRLAATIYDGGKRMERMTGALFDLTRARLGGGLPIARTPLDLKAVVERVFEEHRLAAPAHELALHVAGDLCGEWDGTRVEQLLSNLLGNAVQHGASEAAIEVHLSGTSPDHVVLSVRNGGTIPEHVRPHLFDPFRRRHGRHESDGLGLGLFIVQQIALSHDGRVEVDSSPASGTTFRVTMPRRSHATEHRVSG